MININVKRNNDKAHLPKFMTRDSAGADLVAMSIIKNSLFKVWYDCKISIEIPKGYIGLILPRWEIKNKPLMLANSVGLISSSYRGSYQVCFNRTFWGIFSRKRYNIGDRIAQILILKDVEVKYKDVKSLDVEPKKPKYVRQNTSRQTNVVNT